MLQFDDELFVIYAELNIPGINKRRKITGQLEADIEK